MLLDAVVGSCLPHAFYGVFNWTERGSGHVPFKGWMRYVVTV